MSYLGIDLGTSGLRALLVDSEGGLIGSAERPLSVSNPRSGWSEQDPADWVLVLKTVVEELRNRHSEFSALKGIGVAGHMHGATLLDKTGSVIRPCILWNDTRSHAEAAVLDRMPGIQSLSGSIVFPGFTAPKLEWIRKYEPENFAKVAKVLLPAAYLNYYLTGGFVADMSDSSGTSWLDVGARDWSEMLLAAGHMRADQMPRLVEGSAPAGELRSEISGRWGLSQNVVVAGGAGDNAAAACGVGALAEGQGFVSLGTSGVILVSRDGYYPLPESAVHTFCHAVPHRWYQMGVMLSATASLDWLSRITGQSHKDLITPLGSRPKAAGAVKFLPYLSGERTPHNDADIRGAFTGLDTQTAVEDLTRAVLEGVAYGLRDSADALKTAGATYDHLVAIGGGTASAYWVRLIATVLGVPLAIPHESEFGVALGAARLAIASVAEETPEAIMKAPEIKETIEPDLELVSSFDEGFHRFQESYPIIRSAQ